MIALIFAPQLRALALCGVLCGVLCAASAPVCAQNFAAPTSADSTELARFLSGRAAPLNVKFADMKTGWQMLRVARRDAKPRTATPVGSDRFWNEFESRFGGDGEHYFTRGQTVRWGDEDHLVLYSAQFPARAVAEKWFQTRRDANTPLQTPPQTARVLQLTREFLGTIPVRASLVSSRDVGALEEIAPFNFETQFAALSDVIRTEMDRTQPPSATAAPAVRAPASAPRTGAPAGDVTGKLGAISRGVTQYQLDHDGVLPPLETLAVAKTALKPYLKNGDVLWMENTGSDVASQSAAFRAQTGARRALCDFDGAALQRPDARRRTLGFAAQRRHFAPQRIALVAGQKSLAFAVRTRC